MNDKVRILYDNKYAISAHHKHSSRNYIYPYFSLHVGCKPVDSISYTLQEVSGMMFYGSSSFFIATITMRYTIKTS